MFAVIIGFALWLVDCKIVFLYFICGCFVFWVLLLVCWVVLLGFLVGFMCLLLWWVLFVELLFCWFCALFGGLLGFGG